MLASYCPARETEWRASAAENERDLVARDTQVRLEFNNNIKENEQVNIMIALNASSPHRERASLWRSLQGGFGHHLVDKPQHDNEDLEFVRPLKFAFILVCCFSVLW